MVGSLVCSLVRVLLDLIATRHRDQATLQAEVLALRRQDQVLERQIKRAAAPSKSTAASAKVVRLPDKSLSSVVALEGS